jgi:succinate-semialdehyde dehydrogenase / glutarate-semialdehyde dehydrogenase
LAAGCSVILKPAEETPATACLFAQCFLDAGLPKGVLNLVFGDPDEVSRTLVLSPITRLVTLTGSIHVGKHLTRLAAETMKPVLMELGGHAPVLIDQDVNHDEVAQLATNWKFRMAGQFCSAPSRFLVHRSVYEDFVESLASKAGSLKVGDGFAEGVQMGPLANRRRLAAMSDLVDDAVAHGARVAAGGKRVGNRGWFYAPTVLADVPLDARIMNEEPFGPIAPCAPVDSMDEALAISNSLSMGLAAFVFTNSIERADYLSRELQVGSAAVNVFTSPGADAPFGGIRESGIGREGGLEMYQSYTVAKTIAERRVRV